MSQIAAGFELEAGWGDRTPIEVVCEAHKKVRSIGGIVDTFDAKPVGQAAPIGGGPGEPADAGRVRDLIGAAPSIPELKRVWVEHRSAFDTAPDLLEAYKARGRALQSA
ncbi:hypothetical protein [Salininema proteolyticum]|uniref:Uncharacterized protein n=1 Tax=Salininema proteolyticum TaxID=1607685 RepID=A0ABV8TUF7_9ACTN